MKNKRRTTRSTGVICIFAASTVFLIASQQTCTATPLEDPPPDPEHSFVAAENLSAAFRNVARNVRPSVVRVTSEVQAPFGRTSEYDKVPFSRDFEGFPKGNSKEFLFQQPNEQNEEQSIGHGTGVVIDSTGYIVTNLHVIEGADTLRVTLHDDRSYVAELIATDEESDIAVIQIDAPDLVAARFGDSDETQVGDWVIAIGSPFGLDQTVTAGIISAKGRSTVGIAEYEDFLQTDAPINPGNSGGPLLNLRGEIIGINTAITSRSGASAGVGFAIPSRLVQRVSGSLISDGYVERGQIGVVMQTMSQELADSFGFDGQGVVVAQLITGGTAEKAGLQPGDIVTAIRHRPVHHPSDVRNIIANTDPGTEVLFTVFRNGQKQEFLVEVGSRDIEFESKQSRNSDEQPINPNRPLGLTLEGQKTLQQTVEECTHIWRWMRNLQD